MCWLKLKTGVVPKGAYFLLAILLGEVLQAAALRCHRLNNGVVNLIWTEAIAYAAKDIIFVSDVTDSADASLVEQSVSVNRVDAWGGEHYSICFDLRAFADCVREFGYCGPYCGIPGIRLPDACKYFVVGTRACGHPRQQTDCRQELETDERESVSISHVPWFPVQ
jgi:hypothetical protein